MYQEQRVKSKEQRVVKGLGYFMYPLRHAKLKVWGMRNQSSYGGFTIVELMIATSIFSVLLLLCSTAIIDIGRQFYKGTITNRTQQTARQVVEDVAQAAQFSSGSTSVQTQTSGSTTAYCIGQIRYTFINDKSLGGGNGQSTHVLWKDHIVEGNCSVTNGVAGSLPNLAVSAPSNDTDGQEMLGSNMRVPTFTISKSGNTISVNLTVSYGQDDTVFVTDPGPPLTADYTKCLSTRVGGQFCAVSTISTNVGQRL